MANGFTLDPNKIKTGIAQAFERTEAARETALSTITKSSEQIRASNEAQARNMELYGERSVVHLDRMSDALDNLTDISAVPPGVADFLSIFDSDWSSRKQVANMQKAEFELNRLNMQKQRSDTSAALTASTAKAQAETAVTQFNITRQGFVDAVSAAEAGFAIEENVRESELKSLRDMDIAKLREFAADPSKAPANLQDKPGMIQSILIERTSQELGVRAQELNLELNKDVLEQRRRENMLRKFDKSNLQAMLENNNFPPGLDTGAVTDEIARRQSLEDDLTASAIALEQGKMQLAQNKKIAAANAMTIGETQTALQQALDNNGRTKVGNVDFTATELRTSLLQKQQVEREQRNIQLSQIAAKAATTGAVAEVETTARGLTGAMNPGTPYNPQDPSAGLPPQMAAKMKGFEAQLEAMNTLQEAGVNTVEKQVEILNEMKTEMAKVQEDFIKAQPTETQNGYRQFIENGGIIEDVKAASDYLAASPSPFALNYDPILAKPYEAFANALNDLASQQVKTIGTAAIDEESGQLQIVEQDDLDPAQLVDQALRESKAGDILAQMYTQKLMANSIISLSGGNENSIWSGIVDPETGRFDERVFSEQGTFEFKRLAQLLAAKSVNLRERGIMPAGQSMNSLLVDKAVELSPALQNIGRQDPTAAAFVKMAFNNRPQLAVNSLLMRFRDQEQPALKVALEQQMQLQNEANATVNAVQETGDPGFIGQVLQGLGGLSGSAFSPRRSTGMTQTTEPTAFEQEIRNILNAPAVPQSSRMPEGQ